MLRVSAVIPCYNGARYLAEAIASVKVQTRPVEELVVVDDGSIDGSGELAESLGARVVRQENRGDGAARNRGTAAARGDAIAWLDADDRWRPDHVAVVAGLLERHPGAAGAFGAVRRFGLDDAYIPGYVPFEAEADVLVEAFRDWLHATIGAVVRRSSLVAVGGFDEAERYAVDFDLWLRLARHHRFVATPEVTADWRWHTEQQSRARHLQLRAVYRYRRRFLDQLRSEGDQVTSTRLEQEFVAVWRRDLKAALRAQETATVEAVLVSAPLVHALPRWEAAAWAVASRSLRPALTGGLRLADARRDGRPAPAPAE